MTHDPDLGVLVRRIGSTSAWATPEMTAYVNEDHLQRIIADDPDRVPGVPEGTIAVRELPTSAGPADVCIVSLDGTLTLVECKLASNSERRRMVIGQVLDYAAAIWRDGDTAFHEQWARRSGDALTALDDGGYEQLGRNIAAGRIHLCLAPTSTRSGRSPCGAPNTSTGPTPTPITGTWTPTPQSSESDLHRFSACAAPRSPRGGSGR
ncbi:hypothetical protein MPY17_32525 [Rhodococcus opacus]|uniref:hypothetical protein n=1 Tax=Rhodococcus opacus TaxID=37919 RepID=UPI001FF4FD8E|nr:hypothetical protein [Rhodococcus opacus]UOT03606.1 hypothetical protein MPY17_32525 [Rhodococcus opacus]